jgi:adenylate cyclase
VSSERVERRLAAVLAADVAGYSRLMGRDEEGTLAQLKSFRKSLVDPAIFEYRGRIVKTTGDGMLAEFASAVDAARCAIEVQRGMAKQNTGVPQEPKIEFRIGIHLGDIIIDDNDIFGDGVNIAARLEAIAEPGGVCISDDAHRQIRGKVDVAFEDMGVQTLKNIAEPMRVWQIRVNSVAASAKPAYPPGGNVEPQPREKCSIAVLPFQNMSGDPEQDYFTDGVVDDIITALSRFRYWFVIARSSSFTYKGRAVDIKQVGRELGVRYVLEGGVRKAAGKVRITCQLVDAATGLNLWADRFEGDLTDIFVLQDEVAVKVISAVGPKVTRTEIEWAARQAPRNLSAYDLHLRGLQHYFTGTPAGVAEALRLFYRALELDPRYGRAAVMAGSCIILNIGTGQSVDAKSEAQEAKRLLQLALSIDENDADTLALGGHITAWAGDFDTAIEMVDRSIALNPNSAAAWRLRGWTYQYVGQAEEAVRSFERSIPLSPLDPMLYSTFTGMALAFIRLQRFDEAVVVSEKALRKNQTYSPIYRCLAAALAHLGRDVEAKDALARLLELEPNLLVSELVAQRSGLRWPRLLVEGLRKAGLPE